MDAFSAIGKGDAVYRRQLHLANRPCRVATYAASIIDIFGHDRARLYNTPLPNLDARQNNGARTNHGALPDHGIQIKATRCIVRQNDRVVLDDAHCTNVYAFWPCPIYRSRGSYPSRGINIHFPKVSTPKALPTLFGRPSRVKSSSGSNHTYPIVRPDLNCNAALRW